MKLMQDVNKIMNYDIYKKYNIIKNNMSLI